MAVPPQHLVAHGMAVRFAWSDRDRVVVEDFLLVDTGLLMLFLVSHSFIYRDRTIHM